MKTHRVSKWNWLHCGGGDDGETFLLQLQWVQLEIEINEK